MLLTLIDQELHRPRREVTSERFQALVGLRRKLEGVDAAVFVRRPLRNATPRAPLT